MNQDRARARVLVALAGQSDTPPMTAVALAARVGADVDLVELVLLELREVGFVVQLVNEGQEWIATALGRRTVQTPWPPPVDPNLPPAA